MASSKSTNTYNRQHWEDSEFPILCSTCLGDNPYMRMMKERYGSECKVCTRPFTTYRWCPGRRMRFKKTEICQTCAKIKNICQTCLLDLQYGLPVQVRDEVLRSGGGHVDDVPKSDVNREYYLQQMDKQLASNEPNASLTSSVSPIKHEKLMRLARTTPYYKRNRPHICSFWVKGECKRGEECPYRHERPSDPDDPLSDQNLRDRYYGVNDPVADKILNKASSMPALQPPEDGNITTLYVGNIDEEVIEEDLRNYFYQFGEIRSVHMATKQNCAFVQFTKRQAAEMAAEKAHDKLIFRGKKAVVRWGRSQGKSEAYKATNANQGTIKPVPGLPKAQQLTVAPPTEELRNNFFNLGQANLVMPPPPPPPVQATSGNLMPPGVPTVHYPSQDPSRMGASHFK